MIERVENSVPTLVNIGMVAVGIGLDRWIRGNQSWLQTHCIPPLAAVSLADGMAAWGAYRLLGQGVQLMAGGRGSWDKVQPKRIVQGHRAGDSDDKLFSYGDWSKSKKFEFAVAEPKYGPHQFSVDDTTQDGRLYGKGGAIEIRKAGQDVTFSLYGDGEDGRVAHKACLGYLRTVAYKNELLYKAAGEMMGNAVLCVWEYTRRIAVWSFKGWLYATPTITNYQAATLRPLDKPLDGHTHALHTSLMGNMGVFVMERNQNEWKTLRKLVQVNDEFDFAGAAYLLKPDNIVCMVSGAANKWVREQVKIDKAFAPEYAQGLFPSAKDVRDKIIDLHGPAPVVVFSVPEN